MKPKLCLHHMHGFYGPRGCWRSAHLCAGRFELNVIGRLRPDGWGPRRLFDAGPMLRSWGISWSPSRVLLFSGSVIWGSRIPKNGPERLLFLGHARSFMERRPDLPHYVPPIGLVRDA